MEAAPRRIQGRALLMALAGVVALAFCLAPSRADAASDATVQTSTFTLSFNNDGGTTAFCPPGTTATGGGFGTMNPPPLNVAINVSAPVNSTELPVETHTGDRATDWYANAYSGAGSTEDMKVLAVCSASARGRLVVANFSVPPSKTKSKIVSCPKGQRALGGGLGIATSPISGVYEEGSGPLAANGSTATGASPQAWKVAAYNGFSAARKFQALVICSKTVRPHIVALTLPVAPNNDVENKGECPPGQRALGGGVLVSGKPTSELQFEENGPLGAALTTVSTNDGDAPVAWDGDVYNRSTTTRNFTTLAVCA